MSSLPFSAFTADGFRGLRSLEVSELRSFNVFVGGNNSGKTSVLEVLALLSNPTSGFEWSRVIRRRDYGRLDESLVVSLKWCFSQSLVPDESRSVLSYIAEEEIDEEEEEEVIEFSCLLTATGSLPIREMRSQYREWTEEAPVTREEFETAASMSAPDLSELQLRQCEVLSELTWARPGESSTGSDEQTLRTLPTRSSRLKVNDRGVQLAVAGGAARPGLVHKTKQGHSFAVLLPYSYQLNTLQVAARSSQLFLDDNALLLHLMRQFDPEVLNVEVASFTGARPAIYVKHAVLGVAPLSVFGDAMRRCLLLATTLTSLGRGGVLLLDEVEAGVHIESLPKLFKWLVGAAREVGVQIFATTHSLEMLDALLAAEVNEEDLAAFQIRQGDERTECRRFSFDSLKRLRYERGLDIR